MFWQRCGWVVLGACCPCGYYLTLHLCFWSERPFAPSFCSSDAPAVLTCFLVPPPNLLIQNSLGFWILSWGFGWRKRVSLNTCTHPSPYPDLPNSLHSLTKVEICSHSVLTFFVDFIFQKLPSYSVSSLISEFPAFPVELWLHLTFQFVNKNDWCWYRGPLFPQISLCRSSFDYECWASSSGL